MSRPFIVMGDKTSHGGTVISADFTSDIHGKAMARVGDMVVCPKCKGVFAINSGAPDHRDHRGSMPSGREHDDHLGWSFVIQRPHGEPGASAP